MNKIILLLSLILSFTLPLNSFSQARGENFTLSYPTRDPGLVLLGESHTKFYYLKTDDMLMFKSKADAKKFIDTTASAFPYKFDEIDFSENILILFSYHGSDCHASFRYYTDESVSDKIFTVNVDIIYGGCRAGGNFMSTWGLIPKFDNDYKIEFKTRQIDNFER
jgi:hypothetical protein